MGTSYHITVANSKLSRSLTASLHAEIDERLARINKLMSTYDPESELSRFNKSKSTAAFPVSEETAMVVRAALRFSDETDGAFDITVGPLVNLWGFGPDKRNAAVPTRAEISSALKNVGFRYLSVGKGPSLKKDVPGLQADLSAIAKGYGVDAVAELLAGKGFTDYMVEIGGEVVVRGSNPDGEPWRIGVDRPTDHAVPGRKLSAVAPLTNAAVATSGNYRNFFRKDGVRYSHFIDPRTGRPVTNTLASASVIAPTCMQADAAATAVMVLGPKKGKAWIEKHPGWEAILIVGKPDGTFREITTTGFPRID